MVHWHCTCTEPTINKNVIAYLWKVWYLYVTFTTLRIIISLTGQGLCFGLWSKQSIWSTAHIVMNNSEFWGTKQQLTHQHVHREENICSSCPTFSATIPTTSNCACKRVFFLNAEPSSFPPLKASSSFSYIIVFSKNKDQVVSFRANSSIIQLNIQFCKRIPVYTQDF